MAAADPRYALTLFENWDCIGVRTPFAWDDVHKQILEGFGGPDGPQFRVHADLLASFEQDFDSSLQECPLGSVYIALVGMYSMRDGQIGESQQDKLESIRKQAERLSIMLGQLPILIIAGSRWPVHEALQHFRRWPLPFHQTHQTSPFGDCKQGATGIDWQQLLEVSGKWSEQGMLGLDPGEGSSEYTSTIIAALEKIAQDPSAIGDAAQDECTLGFLFICLVQTVAATARQTSTLDVWAVAVDSMLGYVPFFTISSSRWPIFQVLAMLSILSKGPEYGQALPGFQSDVYRWAGAHPVFKNFRAFGDLRLSRDEILPFGADQEALMYSQMLSRMDGLQWQAALGNWRITASLRPGFRNALDAVMQALRSSLHPGHVECGHSGISRADCIQRGCSWRDSVPQVPSCQRKVAKRKLLLTSFVWGHEWSRMIPRFIAWMHKLKMATVLVSMGKSCRDACTIAAQAVGGFGSGLVTCWDPFLEEDSSGLENEHGSILQRHAMIHLLLHLGVDVLAFDFDTFWFQDARAYLEEIADHKKADVLMTKHLDSDCLNMGLLYIRSSAQTAKWYTKYFAWLHLHPYEDEQRGMNALLGFTKQKVSFAPEMPQLVTFALDDANEFASSRGGWLGDWHNLRFFHWVNPVETTSNWRDVKLADLDSLYLAALHSSTDLASHGWALGAAILGAPDMSIAKQTQTVLEDFKVSQHPERRSCW
ncbi:P-type domain-containing protein [Durusdinium trenchii]|uniref:P-type domain-containing protein n=1 Tax=Durusdinium trenchii TaxID=1381693 RepID=A0ABP0RBI8_9DINO